MYFHSGPPMHLLSGLDTGMVIERDFRKLTPTTQAELRRIAVAMVRAGKTRIEAAETVWG